MAHPTDSIVKDIAPEDAFAALKRENAGLVDCRTMHEWNMIGVPDLSGIGKETLQVEWKQGPAMTMNPNFVEELETALGGAFPETLYFICRSGVRSRDAATVMAAHLQQAKINCACVNVAEGFEGRQPSDTASGWRDKGLPWTSRERA